MSSEHDLTAILIDLKIDNLVSVFRREGFSHDESFGSEHKLISPTIELFVRPYTPGDSDSSSDFLVGGEIECPPEDLSTTVGRLVELFALSGARYLLEVEPANGDKEIVIRHPEFTRPEQPQLEGAVTFETGTNHQPYGLDRIIVHRDGRFLYEHHEREQVTNRKAGTLSAGTVTGIAAELRAARFPNVPVHDTPPGGGYLRISVPGKDMAMINMHTGRNFVGYGHLIASFLQWMSYLSSQSPAGKAPHGMSLDE